MAPRFIKVDVAGRDPVEVRVVTQHPNDDELRKQLYRVEAIWDYCDAQQNALAGYTKYTPEGEQVFMPPTVPMDNAEKHAEVLAGLKIKRDGVMRDLCKLVLADKLTGEAQAELLAQCGFGTIAEIFWASKGVDRRKLTNPVPTDSPPNSPAS